MKQALVIGRARGVWEEVAQAMSVIKFDYYIAVNSAGCDFPYRLHHWVTYHGYEFEKWIDLRWKNGYADAEHYWTSTFGRKQSAFERKLNPGVLNVKGGASGMLGLQVGLRFADHVVLAGIPMDAESGHYDTEGDWDEAMRYRRAWTDLLPKVHNRISSMSGWTRKYFGAPYEIVCYLGGAQTEKV